MGRTSRSATSHWLIHAAPVVVALTAWTGARDPFESAKFAVLLGLAAIWSTSALREAAQRGSVSLPTSPVAIGIAALLVSAGIATVAAPAPGAALFGVVSRYEGWLTYGAAGLLGLAAIGAASIEGMRRFALLVLGGLTVLGLYGVLQLAGVEPLGVTSVVSGVFVTLSNPNFAGAWAGSLAGLAVWQLIDTAAPTWRRVLGGVALASSGVIVLGAASVVGYAATGVSLGVVMLAWLSVRDGSAARLGIPVTISLGTIAAVLGGLGAFEVGPLASIGATVGVRLRRFYWDAAVGMLADNPLLGVGFDGFIASYRAYRSPAAADAVELVLETDSAHSVPLQLAAGGGGLVLLAYLALVTVSVWAILRALRRVELQDRLVVAAVASVWAGLFVQSLASFDLAALLSLSMVSIGLVAGVAWPDRRVSLTLPGVRTSGSARAAGKAGGKAGRGRTGKPGRGRTATGPRASTKVPTWMVPVSTVLGMVLVATALVVGTRPVAAELAAGRAVGAQFSQQPDVAAVRWGEAASRGTWEPDYPYRQGLADLQAGDLEQGLAAFDEALARQPGHLASLVSQARALMALDRDEEAAVKYREALIVEPTHLDLKVEAARALAQQDPQLAASLITQIRDRDPEHPELAELEDLLARQTDR